MDKVIDHLLVSKEEIEEFCERIAKRDAGVDLHRSDGQRPADPLQG